MNDLPYTVPVFPENDRASQAWSRIEPKLERLHDEFLGSWRKALSAIIPAVIELDFEGMSSKPYAQFVKDAAAFSDIHVYEVEALQSLCAWSLDPGFVGAAVDHMFGGSGRPCLVDLPPRRGVSPIEEGVRRRLVEALATAYESVWQTLHPIRLNALRQEALLSSLRLTASSDHVVHARFSAKIQAQNFPFELCLPLRALEVLDSATGLTSVAHSAAVFHADIPNEARATVAASTLDDTHVNIEAVLGDMDLTVAQLMSLSIGQVLPLRMSNEVTLEVDGVCIATGQGGVRGGRNAVKVNVSKPSRVQPSGADFESISSSLQPDSVMAFESPIAAGAALSDAQAQFDNLSTAEIHDPEQPQ